MTETCITPNCGRLAVTGAYFKDGEKIAAYCPECATKVSRLIHQSDFLGRPRKEVKDAASHFRLKEKSETLINIAINKSAFLYGKTRNH